MKTLFCNLILDLEESDFLSFYLVYVIVILVIAYFIHKSVKESITVERNKQNNFDEYDIALLRNGIRDVIGLALFNLTRKGFLLKSKKERLYRNPNPDNTNRLNREEKLLLEECSYKKAKKVKTILGSIDLHLEDAIDTRKERLEKLGFLLPKNINNTIIFIQIVTLGFIVVLGVYRNYFPIGEDNQKALFAIGVIASILVFVIIRRRRLSVYGKKYLANLQVIYADKKSINPNKEKEYYIDENVGLYLGIFGLSILNDTNEYSYLASEYQRSTYSSGGCGGACSSCGSCGGGGCGGCGGCGG